MKLLTRHFLRHVQNEFAVSLIGVAQQATSSFCSASLLTSTIEIVAGSAEHERLRSGILALVGNMTRDILPFPFLPEHSMIGFRDNGLESLRSKLRNMTETELVRFGKAAQERCLKTVEKKLLIELEEARAEWRRRHPKRRTNSYRV